MTRPKRLFVGVVVAGALIWWRAGGNGADGGATSGDAPAGSVEGVAVADEIRDVGVTNRSGRSGAYYVPPDIGAREAPLLLLLHPTGSSGRRFLPAFLAFAKARGFAIVAPDSNVRPDGYVTWQPGEVRSEVTEDLRHAMAALEWVISNTGLRVDRSHVLVAGFSGGGVMAPYIATQRPPFTHAAVLHGHPYPDGFGNRRVALWLSTGDRDDFAPEAEAKVESDALRRTFREVHYTVYSAEHRLVPEEKEALIEWWLGR